MTVGMMGTVAAYPMPISTPIDVDERGVRIQRDDVEQADAQQHEHHACREGRPAAMTSAPSHCPLGEHARETDESAALAAIITGMPWSTRNATW